MDDRNQFRKQADHPPFQDLGNIRDDFMDDRHLFKKQTDHRPLQDSRNITEDFMDDQNHSRLEQRMEELGEQTPLQDSFDRLDRQGIASLLQERISLLDDTGLWTRLVLCLTACDNALWSVGVP